MHSAAPLLLLNEADLLPDAVLPPVTVTCCFGWTSPLHSAVLLYCCAVTCPRIFHMTGLSLLCTAVLLLFTIACPLLLHLNGLDLPHAAMPTPWQETGFVAVAVPSSFNTYSCCRTIFPHACRRFALNVRHTSYSISAVFGVLLKSQGCRPCLRRRFMDSLQEALREKCSALS